MSICHHCLKVLSCGQPKAKKSASTSSSALLERGRISARLSASVQNRMQEAADIMGVTLNQFLIQAKLEKTEQVIERERVLTLSRRDAATIQRMLDNPPKPNKVLAKAQQRYQTQLAHGAFHTSA